MQSETKFNQEEFKVFEDSDNHCLDVGDILFDLYTASAACMVDCGFKLWAKRTHLD